MHFIEHKAATAFLLLLLGSAYSKPFEAAIAGSKTHAVRRSPPNTFHRSPSPRAENNAGDRWIKDSQGNLLYIPASSSSKISTRNSPTHPGRRTPAGKTKGPETPSAKGISGDRGPGGSNGETPASQDIPGSNRAELNPKGTVSPGPKGNENGVSPEAVAGAPKAINGNNAEQGSPATQDTPPMQPSETQGSQGSTAAQPESGKGAENGRDTDKSAAGTDSMDNSKTKNSSNNDFGSKKGQPQSTMSITLAVTGGIIAVLLAVAAIYAYKRNNNKAKDTTIQPNDDEKVAPRVPSSCMSSNSRIDGDYLQLENTDYSSIALPTFDNNAASRIGEQVANSQAAHSQVIVDEESQMNNVHPAATLSTEALEHRTEETFHHGHANALGFLPGSKYTTGKGATGSEKKATISETITTTQETTHLAKSQGCTVRPMHRNPNTAEGNTGSISQQSHGIACELQTAAAHGKPQVSEDFERNSLKSTGSNEYNAERMWEERRKKEVEARLSSISRPCTGKSSNTDEIFMSINGSQRLGTPSSQYSRGRRERIEIIEYEEEERESSLVRKRVTSPERRKNVASINSMVSSSSNNSNRQPIEVSHYYAHEHRQSSEGKAEMSQESCEEEYVEEEYVEEEYVEEEYVEEEIFSETTVSNTIGNITQKTVTTTLYTDAHQTAHST